jgi:putative endonuclease
MTYIVYMLRCEDGSYYIGTTNDLTRRYQAHCSGKCARYTRSHRPIAIVYQEICQDKGEALRRERVLKQLSHEAKSRLLETE